MQHNFIPDLTPSSPIYIACAELSHRSAAQNAVARELAEAVANFRGVPFVAVSGAYKGSREISLLLSGPNAHICALELARIFAQESILRIEIDAAGRLSGTLLGSADDALHYFAGCRLITCAEACESGNYVAISGRYLQFY